MLSPQHEAGSGRASRSVLLFRRDFPAFSGGELKFRHYFAHAEHSTRFQPRIFLAPNAAPEAAALWRGTSSPPLREFKVASAAALFLAGLDWSAVPDPAPVPVINLVQGVRHADPGSALRSFLSRPATRICVSQQVADAILATGLVNGPVHVIPAGLDRTELPPPSPVRDVPIVIAGLKNPGFARSVHARLATAGIVAECLTEPMPRRAYLERIARAKVAITLPLDREGFFLPALEAMALGAITVCPDCVGNRGFCRDGETAFRPPYEVDDVFRAARFALALDPVRSNTLLTAAAAQFRRHSLHAERTEFLRILDALPLP
jgi:hypothetical protein